MRKHEEEGGCGVIGLACEAPIKGKHLLPSLCQMVNRGNGKGGGIAAAGLSPKAFGTTHEILNHDTLLAIAYLDESCQKELEEVFIKSNFTIDHIHTMPRSKDAAPKVVVYFVQPKSDDETYRIVFQINSYFYSSTSDKRAFVLSASKNLLVLKMVGNADDVIRNYHLEEFTAKIWIGHHRYPTKGRVWHPGGAHPFVGLHEALVHNGDFANYYSICETLAMQKITPLFLTDTEAAVLLFDLLHRTYKYPIEYVIETLAPTTERDWTQLPEEKRTLYRQLQQTHMHASPDGPWFFLIAKAIPELSLIGITDTSMLRPQVFALQKGPVPIGIAASEKQAIDAVLASLAREDNRFWDQADYYWNARGGSYIDGGAFIFTLKDDKLICTNKFGKEIYPYPLPPPYHHTKPHPQEFPSLPSKSLSAWAKSKITHFTYAEALGLFEALQDNPREAIDVLSDLLDHVHPLEKMRRSSLSSLIMHYLETLFAKYKVIGNALAIDARGFPQDNTLALEIVQKYKEGFREMIIYGLTGQRFIANGLGSGTYSLQLHIYGSPGDYLASGIDGAKIYVHNTAQDQVAQIMNEGTLIIYGDVGQAFMYGAKGGKAFIRGNTAGRPLINAVGKPRVVINGTCLDYCAESFMAGDPLQGGGFVIINGLAYNDNGELIDLPNPYPGNNLFSLASGGAIYIRDPYLRIEASQLNGGEFISLTQEDWNLILPYLEENAQLFDIPISRLLEVDGKTLPYSEVYRKIHPVRMRVLQEEEAWVKARD